MLELPRPKLGPAVELVAADVLEVFDRPDHYDAVVSTYAIHHLTADEKAAPAGAAAARMSPGGRFVVGDLMVGSPGLGPRPCASSGPPRRRRPVRRRVPSVVDEILVAPDRVGFRGLVVEQLSDLSWGVAARVP